MDEMDRLVDGFMIGTVLTIIILRICGVINWPWIWITAVIWIPLLIGIILALILAIAFIVITLLEKIGE